MATPTWLLAPFYTFPLPTPSRVLRPCRAACGCCCFVGQFGGTWCLAPCWAVNRAWPPVSHMACSHPATHLPLAPLSCCLRFVVVIVVDANAKRAFRCSDAWAEPSLRCTWLRMREARSKRGHSKNIQQQQAESPLPFLPLSPTSLPFSSLLPKLCKRKQAGGNFNVRM